MKAPVEIVTRDGVVLRGEAESGGPVWLVFVHELGSDLDLWHPPLPLGGNVSVLAVDLRGHGGSEGAVDPSLTAHDLVDVSAFARDNGAERIVIAAAGSQVQPALDAAFEAAALGVIAIGPLLEEVEGSGLSKLAIVASKDPRQVTAGRALRRSSGSAIVISLPIAGECDAIISGGWRTNVAAYIRAFVRDVTRRTAEVRQ